MQIVLFSKMLHEYDISRAGDLAKELGFDGVDLTVRDNGHVLPENVAQDLPRAVEVLQAKGLEVPMITTGITNAAEGHAETIIKTAADCGIRQLKLGYWLYTEFGRIKQQIEACRRDLEGITQLAQQAGVTVNLHCHSGAFLTAEPAVIYLLVRDYPRHVLGAYLDLAHIVIEGARDGWRQGIDLLGEWINLVAAKAYSVLPTCDALGNIVFQPKLVPPPASMVPYPEMLKCLKAVGFDGTVSLHAEYDSWTYSFQVLKGDELLEQIRLDLQYLRRVVTQVYG